MEIESEVDISGWIKSKRDKGNSIFIDLEDSTDFIQVTVKKDAIDSKKFQAIKKIAQESSIRVIGVLKEAKDKAKEIDAKRIEMIGPANISLTPSPRSNFDIFDSKYSNLTMEKRHLYLRNKKMMSVLKFKNNFLFSLHEYFQKRNFVFIDAPVITQTLLYDDKTAFSFDFFGTRMFLSQCVAFQLEAAVHGFEKVYNITPSFRAEHSRTNRHLAEYWHLKAEIAFMDLNEMMSFAEDMVYNTVNVALERSEKEMETLGVSFDVDEIKPPYQKITYDEAVEMVRSKGKKMEWGRSLGADEERIISENTSKPVFIVGMPCSAEGFPFSKDPKNPQLTRTADLIPVGGFGEVLGVAEKICTTKELLERMKEKGKDTKEQLKRYKWYQELREYGCVPHSGLGMGIERIVRWVLQLPHVKYAISFPRLYRRVPYP
ncbi:MAG: asparagine--tRNA ligase [Nitrososphaerota archaeon]